MNRSDGKPKVYNKSYKTKWKIGMTLMNILDRKPLDKIRVQEICDSADIHRSTFFYRIKKIEDLLEISITDSKLLFLYELSFKIWDYLSK